MSVIDKLSSISDTLSSVFKFAQENSEIKEDFDEYLKTLACTMPLLLKSIQYLLPMFLKELSIKVQTTYFQCI